MIWMMVQQTVLVMDDSQSDHSVDMDYDMLHSDNVDNNTTTASSSTPVRSVSTLSLRKKKKVPAGCKRVYDKVHYCTFCKSRIVSNIARHLITVHIDEAAVHEIMLLPKRSKPRKLLLQKLINDGNFAHNVNTIQQGKGETVVGR